MQPDSSHSPHSGFDRKLEAAVAAAVTIITHLAFGRRTLVGVGLGTLTFVALVNFF